MARRKKSDHEPTTIVFHYIKGNHFRTIHASGAIGSITPSGDIHCALFNERPAIPRVTQHSIDPGGQLSQQVIVEGRDGFVRELEVDLVMDIDTAKNLRDWLELRISEAVNIDKIKAQAMRKRRDI